MSAAARRTEAEIRLLEQLGMLRQFYPRPGGKAELIAELELRRLERLGRGVAAISAISARARCQETKPPRDKD